MENAVRPHLSRPPCIVSFSGGRDSSAVLAVATSVARREGLELPIPVSLRYANAPQTHEDEWQELVIRALGLQQWERLAMTDELEFLGPVWKEVLQELGVVWPVNAGVMHRPIIPLARGGSLLTGFPGDWLFGKWRWRPAMDVLRAGDAPD